MSEQAAAIGERLEFAPVAGALGAEVRGADLAGPLDEPLLGEIRAALARRLVLFFPDQALDPVRLLALTRRFGQPVRVPYVTPMAGHPDVIAVLKKAEERRIVPFGGEWHSDFSFLEAPPSLTLLYAAEVPPFGGDTIWASMQEAWERLSPGLRSLLADMTALHSGHIYGAARPPDTTGTSRSIGIARNNPEADVERAHPVVRRHPWSGRDALFVNPTYTTRFADMTEAESRGLLEHLYGVATRPELCCRRRWAAGDLAIWDNRATMHYAVNDYDGFDRLMYRTTVEGERPLAATGS